MSGRTNSLPYVQNSTLFSRGLLSGSDSQYPDNLALVIVHIVLAIWICLSNGSQLVNILFTPALRRRPRNILLVNICITEMVVGLFLCPLYSYSLIGADWHHSVLTCVLYETVFYVQTCVSSVAVLVLLADRFYYMLNPLSFGAKGKLVLTGLQVLIPWVCGVALVGPLVMQGTRARLNQETGFCEIIWRTKFHTTTVFVSFFLPAFLSLAVTAVSVVIYVLLSLMTKRHRAETDTDRRGLRDSLGGILLVSVTCVGLQFPFFIVTLLEIFCEGGPRGPPCVTSDGTRAYLMLVNMLKPAVTPLVWLAYRDIRNGFGCWCRRSRSCPSPSSADDDVVNFWSRSTLL